MGVKMRHVRVTDGRKVRKLPPRDLKTVVISPVILAVIHAQGVDLSRVIIEEEVNGFATKVSWWDE